MTIHTISSLQAASTFIQQGKILIFPTETLYAIGCDALQAHAVATVFQVKKRPQNLPLPVVIGSMEQVATITQEVSPLARQLMHMFWPGPLTLLLPVALQVPKMLTAGTGTIAVRLSSHPAVQALCRSTGTALVASSANASGAKAPALYAEIHPNVTAQVHGIWNPPPAPSGGLASTIVDIVYVNGREQIKVIREGAIPTARIKAALAASESQVR